MKLGEKIQQLRKEKQLSQEELAEKMGVSRQAVSKWESGSATPEIEKLIELSKLFGVSLNTLLQIEEQQQEKPSPPQVTPAADTTALFYKKQMRRQKKGYFFGLVGVLLLGLVGYAVLKGQMNTLSAQVMNLRGEVVGVQGNINFSIDSIRQEVEETLRQQYDLLTDVSVEALSFLPEEQSAKIDISIIPKNYTNSIEIAVLFSGPNLQTIECNAVPQEDKSFSFTAVLPLEGVTKAIAVVKNGTQEQTQLLQELTDTVADLKEQFLLQVPFAMLRGHSSWTPGAHAWIWNIDGEVCFDIDNKEYSWANKAYLQILRNGAVYRQEEIDLTRPANYGGVISEEESKLSYLEYELPLEESIAYEANDVLQLKLIVEDCNGIRYENIFSNTVIDTQGAPTPGEEENEIKIVFPGAN